MIKDKWGDPEKEFRITDKGKEYLITTYMRNCRFLTLINNSKHKAALTLLLPEIEARNGKKIKEKEDANGTVNISTTNIEAGI